MQFLLVSLSNVTIYYNYANNCDIHIVYTVQGDSNITSKSEVPFMELFQCTFNVKLSVTEEDYCNF